MNSSRFLVRVEPPETCVVEVQQDIVVGFFVEREKRLLSDIFKGIVRDLVPGMDAAFVGIGQGRNALLYAGDVFPIPATAQALGAGADSSQAARANPASIGTLLRAGQEVVVQVARPPVGTKGARVTMRLSLPGRYVVLVSGSDNVGVSRRIEQDEERARLRRVAEKLRPFDHGLIVRTEAEGVGEYDLAQDIAALQAQMQQVVLQARGVTAPALLHRDLGLLARLARDRMNARTQDVLIDSADVCATFKAFLQPMLPHVAERIAFYDDPVPIFERFGVCAPIATATERTVPLPSGGAIVLDEAEALTAIDVNTGRFTGNRRLADTVLQTNLEAVEEAARQMRLRDLGGVIIIDLIDMERSRDRVKVMNALETALKLDRVRTRIVQLSPLGLVELTRQREGQSLRQMTQRACPSCAGSGTVKTPQSIAIETRRAIRGIAARHHAAPEAALLMVRVTLNPETAAAFVGDEGEWVRGLEESARVQIVVRVDQTLHFEATRVESGVAPSELEPELLPDTLLRLRPHEALVPQGAPRFAVVEGRLLRLNDNGDAPPETFKRPLLMRVREANRWFVEVDVVERAS